MHWPTIVSDDSTLLCWSNLQSVGRFANCCSREIANPIALLPLRKFLQHPDELDRPCSSVKPVLQLVEPVGRTYAANVGESVLSDQGVEGVPNNLPMADWSFPQRGHSAPHLLASKCLKNPVSLVWKGGEDSRSWAVTTSTWAQNALQLPDISREAH